MNKKYFGFVIIPIVVIIIGISINFENDNSKVEKFIDPYSSYTILNSNIEDVLEIQGISISSPLKFKSKNAIDKYCSFFSDEKRQDLVKYCISTELRDSNGIFLGNIHIVGDKTPLTLITIIQSDLHMSQKNEIKTIFRIVEEVICDCWDMGPDEFETVDSWIDGIYEFHTSGIKPTSKSQIITLGEKKFQIELTTNFEGYLWKLLVDL